MAKVTITVTSESSATASVADGVTAQDLMRRLFGTGGDGGDGGGSGGDDEGDGGVEDGSKQAQADRLREADWDGLNRIYSPAPQVEQEDIDAYDARANAADRSQVWTDVKAKLWARSQ